MRDPSFIVRGHIEYLLPFIRIAVQNGVKKLSRQCDEYVSSNSILIFNEDAFLVFALLSSIKSSHSLLPEESLGHGTTGRVKSVMLVRAKKEVLDLNVSYEQDNQYVVKISEWTNNPVKNEARFSREARILKIVYGEDKINQLLIEKNRGACKGYLIMPRAQGISVNSLVKRYASERCHIPYEIGENVLRGIVFAVLQIQRKGVVHLDYKLEHFIYDEMRACHHESNIQVIDFGFALQCSAGEQIELRAGCGTPLFIAPELFSRPCHISLATDIYSLGICFFLVLFRMMPFGSERYEEGMMLARNFNKNYEKTVSGHDKQFLALDKGSRIKNYLRIHVLSGSDQTDRFFKHSKCLPNEDFMQLIANLIIEMIDDNPRNRPNVECIARRLHELTPFSEECVNVFL